MFKFIENNEIVLNFFVQLVGMLATVVAVWVALYLARKPSKLNVEMELLVRQLFNDKKDYLTVFIYNKGERELSIAPFSWFMFSHKKAKDGILMVPGLTEKEMYETKNIASRSNHTVMFMECDKFVKEVLLEKSWDVNEILFVTQSSIGEKIKIKIPEETRQDLQKRLDELKNNKKEQ